jgi:hypothetical protein
MRRFFWIFSLWIVDIPGNHKVSYGDPLIAVSHHPGGSFFLEFSQDFGDIETWCKSDIKPKIQVVLPLRFQGAAV